MKLSICRPYSVFRRVWLTSGLEKNTRNPRTETENVNNKRQRHCVHHVPVTHPFNNKHVVHSTIPNARVQLKIWDLRVRMIIYIDSYICFPI